MMIGSDCSGKEEGEGFGCNSRFWVVWEVFLVL